MYVYMYSLCCLSQYRSHAQQEYCYSLSLLRTEIAMRSILIDSLLSGVPTDSLIRLYCTTMLQ